MALIASRKYKDLVPENAQLRKMSLCLSVMLPLFQGTFTPDADPKTVVAMLIDSLIVSKEEKTNSFRPLQKSIEQYSAPIDFTDSTKQDLPFKYIERL
jgi:hypothetical protein